MINGVIDKVKRIRGQEQISFDMSNSNSYRLVVNETDRSKTAYCFSVPIYNRSTGRMLDLKFQKAGGRPTYTGSSCFVDFCSDSIRFSNGNKTVNLVFPAEKLLFSENKLLYKNTEIVPTANGLALFAKADETGQVSLTFKAEKSKDVRANNKYFAIMESKFRPLITVSCIGTADESGGIVAPALLYHRQSGLDSYEITLMSTGTNNRFVVYEINMYERKLFQDTTVESGAPENNNVFGSVAFLGNSRTFGQQWLYWKVDDELFRDISDRRILKAKLYLPVLNSNRERLSAFRVASRFCSFGSNWTNKIRSGLYLGDVEFRSDVVALDITPLIRDEATHRLSRSNGMILRPKGIGGGFVALSTGDSFYMPQILEINYF